jgi:hypothetical protein
VTLVVELIRRFVDQHFTRVTYSRQVRSAIPRIRYSFLAADIKCLLLVSLLDLRLIFCVAGLETIVISRSESGVNVATYNSILLIIC